MKEYLIERLEQLEKRLSKILDYKFVSYNLFPFGPFTFYLSKEIEYLKSEIKQIKEKL